MSHLADAEFTPSSFGGGWIIPKTDRARVELEHCTGEAPGELMPLGGALGWIIEPYQVESLVKHLRDDCEFEVTL